MRMCFLLLAEAENEINHAPTSQAKEMLKQVRQRAFINAVNQAEKVDNYVNNLTTYDAFKQAIIKKNVHGNSVVRISANLT